MSRFPFPLILATRFTFSTSWRRNRIGITVSGLRSNTRLGTFSNRSSKSVRSWEIRVRSHFLPREKDDEENLRDRRTGDGLRQRDDNRGAGAGTGLVGLFSLARPGSQ
jgi:hypothetical protein